MAELVYKGSGRVIGYLSLPIASVSLGGGILIYRFETTPGCYQDAPNRVFAFKAILGIFKRKGNKNGLEAFSLVLPLLFQIH